MNSLYVRIILEHLDVRFKFIFRVFEYFYYVIQLECSNNLNVLRNLYRDSNTIIKRTKFINFLSNCYNVPSLLKLFKSVFRLKLKSNFIKRNFYLLLYTNKN